MSRPQRMTAAKRKAHEVSVISPRQVRRLRKSGGAPAEGSPEDYTVTDAEMGRVRRAIEIRNEERELREALKPGWEL